MELEVKTLVMSFLIIAAGRVKCRFLTDMIGTYKAPANIENFIVIYFDFVSDAILLVITLTCASLLSKLLSFSNLIISAALVRIIMTCQSCR